MVLIEGVGDEVTLLFGVVFLVLVLVLAWISTHTAEPAEPSEHLLSTRPESAAETERAADGLRRREAAGPSLATEPPASASRSTQPSPSEDTPNDTERNMVLRLKFLNDTERVAQVNPEDTIDVLLWGGMTTFYQIHMTELLLRLSLKFVYYCPFFS
uniref:Transmembrane and ubiquitin-like domain containing 1 n=1 Tax=Astyanax mexicanus TaxID=7994 RepID=A0A8B9H5E1_ASTMX